jgi:hypothetical protein
MQADVRARVRQVLSVSENCQYLSCFLSCCMNPLLDMSQVQAFVRSIDKNSSEGADNQQGQELNQSPLPFIEARQLSAPQQSMARKDEIIRVRNAQVRSIFCICLCLAILMVNIALSTFDAPFKPNGSKD